MTPFGGNPENCIEILNIVPQQGPGGIFAPSCEAAISLAVQEINSGTGILGRELRVTHIDGGRDPADVAREVSALLATGMVHAITGWHTSAVRRAVSEAVDGRVPYLFATDHEGVERPPPGLFMIGSNPGRQILPALRWLRRELGARRWAIIGNDYVWPRRTADAVRDELGHRGAADLEHFLPLEKFVPMGTQDFEDFLADPLLDQVDGVIVLLVGADVARFNKQFAKIGRDEKQLRVSPAVDENVLLAAGRKANRNLYVPSSFFVNGAEGMDRLERYRRLHGEFAPALTNFSNTEYEAVRTLWAMAEAANSLDVRRVHAAVDNGAILETPSGAIGFDGNQVVLPGYIARAEGVGFEILDRIS
ncbi:substrate-binding domain-containing protein [Nocardia huaxiensis]|uniref:Substrate-binding domain-containing protein n=1 Tax=Nocardia huaxiensis TaxID=2755382 RepID=A0A7D6ZK23_9NOCA|nr:substrate-binding domain-containing protein [Nocardia huaxiensis]QLY31580.1 substrate-binding domain-containing protein [Nocardia huaxiensis]UFS95133.1 substrate-binding domain-containing protein [Nocardia huaxiensis]